MGKETIDRWFDAIDAGDYLAFLREVMVDYYDMVYKGVETPPLFVVDNTDVSRAAKIIVDWYTAQTL